MGIVHKDPNDPGPINFKEKILRLICEIKNVIFLGEGHDIERIDDNVENLRCKKCGSKFIRPFSPTDRLQIPSRPPPRRKNGPV